MPELFLLPCCDHQPRRNSPLGKVTTDSSTDSRLGEEKSKCELDHCESGRICASHLGSLNLPSIIATGPPGTPPPPARPSAQSSSGPTTRGKTRRSAPPHAAQSSAVHPR